MELKDEKNMYVEKKHFNFAVFLLFLLCATIFLIGYLNMEKKIDKITNSISQTDNKSGNNSQTVFEPAADNETVYKVMAYEDKIGIFKNDTYLYSVNVYIFTLPAEDQKLLTQGIVALSEDELYEILEEYC